MHDRTAPGCSIRFGSFELDVRSGELHKGPSRLKVPDQSIEILKALLEQPGELVTREQLRERLWPSDTFVDFEHGLNAAVRRLREALGDSADTPRFIETLPRRGYRFVGTVDGARASVEPMGQIRSRARFGWLVATLLGLASIAGIVVALRVDPGEPVEPTMFTISAPENHTARPRPPVCRFAGRPPPRTRSVLRRRIQTLAEVASKSRGDADAGHRRSDLSILVARQPVHRVLASRRLWKIRIGGRPEEICATVGQGRGGTWNRSDEIVFSPGGGPLLKVSAAGGIPVAVTALVRPRRDTRSPLSAFPSGWQVLSLLGWRWTD